MDSNPPNVIDYNESLRKISNCLDNARDTFGPSSVQYLTIRDILQECLRTIEDDKAKQGRVPVVDPDVLSVAMGYLEIGE